MAINSWRSDVCLQNSYEGHRCTTEDQQQQAYLNGNFLTNDMAWDPRIPGSSAFISSYGEFGTKSAEVRALCQTALRAEHSPPLDMTGSQSHLNPTFKNWGLNKNLIPVYKSNTVYILVLMDYNSDKLRWFAVPNYHSLIGNCFLNTSQKYMLAT